MVLFPAARFLDPLPPLASGCLLRTLRALRFSSARVGNGASGVASVGADGISINGLRNGDKTLGMPN